MKLFYLQSVVLFSLIISCGSPSEEISPSQEIENTTAVYGNKNFVFPTLSENAKVYITQWGAYEDFENEAKEINGSTLEDLKIKSERLLARIDSLTKKVPDTLRNQPIVSRVMIAKTRASLLFQEVQLTPIDSVNVAFQIDELNEAIKNLIVQINEKFQKDYIDFQRKDDEKKEIEKQKRFLDSVFQSELRDKNSE
jgi:hypothetical protein